MARTRTGTRSTAATAWAVALAAWAIPEAILAAAPVPPYACPPKLFARSAERSMAPDFVPTPSRARALEAVPAGGSVLDVGAGSGAASLPLAPPAARLVAVDESGGMLEAFAGAADRRGVSHAEVLGSWPEVADQVDVADVVVCHHVLYNVQDLVPFAAALTDHARHRVVVELTADHPVARLNPLWKALHGLDRPTSPTAPDAVAVLVEMGLDVHVEDSVVQGSWGPEDREALVAFTRQRLCVGPDRDAEVAALLDELGDPPRPIFTLWWQAGR